MDIIYYISRVLKYWKHDLESLYKENMYLLLPLKVFEVRKKINKIKSLSEETINEIKRLIETKGEH